MSVEYRHEYVSGVVIVRGFPAALSVHVANRGATRGLARVVVLAGTEVASEPALDSGADNGDIPNGVVEPGGVWSYGTPDLPKGVDAKSASYWVVIRTTSPDLIPSLVIEETVSVDGKAQLRECAYFAPGDFAVFPLHPAPSHSPIGPAIEA
jgi:hypothetical protein